MDKESAFGFWFAIPFAFIFLGYMGYQYAVSDSEDDFKSAKIEKNVITCNGLLKSYILQPDKYEVYEDTIRTKIMFVNRTFKLKDCNVESVKGK